MAAAPSSASGAPAALAQVARAAANTWSPAQQCYRDLMVALRGAYYSDRAKLFWARHRVRVEFYKYAAVPAESVDAKQLVGVGREVAKFVDANMKVSVQRIVEHNDTLMKLPVPEAKRFRQRYLEREAEHEAWCKQKVKAMMRRRPAAPYPY